MQIDDFIYRLNRRHLQTPFVTLDVGNCYKLGYESNMIWLNVIPHGNLHWPRRIGTDCLCRQSIKCLLHLWISIDVLRNFTHIFFLHFNWTKLDTSNWEQCLFTNSMYEFCLIRLYVQWMHDFFFLRIVQCRIWFMQFVQITMIDTLE